MTYTEQNTIYLLDLVVLAAMESRQPGHEDALTTTLDTYQMEIGDNDTLWRRLVEVAAIQIAVLNAQVLGLANATEITQKNLDRYMERD
jgi:hypothetical protein